jgi:predicted small lipoprotein YifL
MRLGKSLVAATVAAAILTTLVACGFKGPLRLPNPPSTTDQSKKT